jgi:hypothetical protein
MLKSLTIFSGKALRVDRYHSFAQPVYTARLQVNPGAAQSTRHPSKRIGEGVGRFGPADRTASLFADDAVQTVQKLGGTAGKAA